MSKRFESPYRGYDVLTKWSTPSWNDATRRAVSERLQAVPTRTFLSEELWMVLESVCDRLVPQPDRPDDPVPIAPFVDQKLERNQGDGYRFEAMPPLREAWQRGLRGIDRESEAGYGLGFVRLSEQMQDEQLARVQRGEVTDASWQGLPPERFFSDLLLKTVVGIYYAHPAAWSEIGYGGPASPRGYVRLGFDQRDPWEAKKRRG